MLNLAWHYLTQGGTKKTIDRLRADLIRPLPGQSEEVSDQVVEQELSMFKKAMQTNNKQGR